MRFSANFQDFFKIQKIRSLKLIVSQLFGVSQFSCRSLLVKSHFWCFLDLKNSSYFEFKKSPKMRFYDQVSFVWWLWYSQKLTCNKFEVSDFWNFEKIFKIRIRRQKCVIFTSFFSWLRHSLNEQLLPYVETKPVQLIASFWNPEFQVWILNFAPPGAPSGANLRKSIQHIT